MASILDRVFGRNGKGRGTERMYIDLRDIDGGRPALIPPDSRRAMTREMAELNPDLLEKLARKAMKEALTGQEGEVDRRPESPALEEYARRHIRLKREAAEVVERTLHGYRIALLDDACAFFGADRKLDEIRPKHVQAYIRWLRDQPNGRGGKLSPTTQLARLNCLSNMYRRAVAEDAAPMNPVASRNVYEKPEREQTESDYLEVPEAALVLEAARLHEPAVDDGAAPHIYPIIATFLLTGMRRSELLGLRVEDVSFERDQIHVRRNRWRRLKNDGSKRVVPLWPQLREILRGYLFGREEPLGDLLFPSHRSEEERMLTDLRKSFDAVGELAGLEDGRLRTRLFRHTYTATRIQTLDGGSPVSIYTVSKELGHSSTAMLERVYGHLQDARVRGEVVEYRADEFPKLEDRLSALREVS